MHIYDLSKTVFLLQTITTSFLTAPLVHWGLNSLELRLSFSSLKGFSIFILPSNQSSEWSTYLHSNQWSLLLKSVAIWLVCIKTHEHVMGSQYCLFFFNFLKMCSPKLLTMFLFVCPINCLLLQIFYIQTTSYVLYFK